MCIRQGEVFIHSLFMISHKCFLCIAKHKKHSKLYEQVLAMGEYSFKNSHINCAPYICDTKVKDHFDGNLCTICFMAYVVKI